MGEVGVRWGGLGGCQTGWVRWDRVSGEVGARSGG